MKILNFGSLNIDNVYYLEEFVKPGETISAERMEVFPGGKGLNQSVACSRAGAEVYHAGLFGENGEWLQKYLLNEGIDVTYLNRTSVVQGHAMIQVDESGENCIIVYGGSNYEITEKCIDNVLKNFSEDTILLVQNEISNIDYLINQAHKNKIKIVFNPSPVTEDLIKIDYSKIDWLLVNEIEAEILSKTSTSNDALEYFEKTYPKLNVVLTLGSEGLICLYNKKRIKQEAFKTKVVDTTGAGDTFTGYFVSGLSKGYNIPEILINASKASSICVSKKGAAPSIPFFEELWNTENKQ